MQYASIKIFNKTLTFVNFKMTKLAEWLVTGITLVIVWYNVLIGKLPNFGLTQSQILIAPLVIVGVIGTQQVDF